ncbi:MAG: hypothetical protein GYB20_13035 [Oceanospirillales bacterium]|nr:hypothetical protein [Oceanospirillales bacterium]MBR9888601.1 hypothetical protein [Oceanospirillales bacterium]
MQGLEPCMGAIIKLLYTKGNSAKMEFVRSALHNILFLAMACGFLSMVICMFHILKGQTIVSNAANKKFQKKFGASLPLIILLSKQEIDLHLEKGSLEYKLATKQATSYELFIKSWVFAAVCMVTLIVSSYVFQWLDV